MIGNPRSGPGVRRVYHRSKSFRAGDFMTGRRSLIALAVLALLLAGSAAQALEVGQKAPDFSLPGPGNKPVKLSELTAKGPVVLYTVIQAFTPT
jgi:hypothetical protein